MSKQKDDRLYAKFAINFTSNAKIAILSDAAFRAFVEMVCWSREQLTDGRIQQAYAEKRWSQAVLDELAMNHPDRPSLVRVGGGDYQLHDFGDHQTTTSEIDAKRRDISAKRAAAGRASGAARRAKQTNARTNTQTNTQTNAEHLQQTGTNANKPNPSFSHFNDGFGVNKQTNANPETETETETETSSGSVERASYVSEGEAAAHARASELAMSERTSLSPPVSVGASRLVAALVSDKVSHADRTILRIKASEAINQGRSDDDVAECIRIWLTKPELGPNALLCCLSEVDKRKLTGAKLAPADQKGLEWLALGRQRPNGAVE